MGKEEKMKGYVSIFSEETGIRARLFGEIDHHSAREIRHKVDTAVFGASPSTVTLDFSEVGFMDSSGIALIIGRAEICRSYGATLEITGLSGTMRRVVMLSGVQKIKNVRIV